MTDKRKRRFWDDGEKIRIIAQTRVPVTQPPDPGRLFGDSVRLSFWLGVGRQGPLSGALA
jgi:hypothetical protein